VGRPLVRAHFARQTQDAPLPRRVHSDCARSGSKEVALPHLPLPIAYNPTERASLTALHCTCNEHIPIVRVVQARQGVRLFSIASVFTITQHSGTVRRVGLYCAASTEHILIVRGLRARRPPGSPARSSTLPSREASLTALHCAHATSTFLSCALCEQDRASGSPLPYSHPTVSYPLSFKHRSTKLIYPCPGLGRVNKPRNNPMVAPLAAPMAEPRPAAP
jgi:hypothetical protein